MSSFSTSLQRKQNLRYVETIHSRPFLYVKICNIQKETYRKAAKQLLLAKNVYTKWKRKANACLNVIIGSDLMTDLSWTG